MPNAINTDTMPGDSMSPDTIDAAAGNMRTVGTKVSKQGGTVLSTWQKISASYSAPEETTLFHAMNPVKTEAEAFGTDVGLVATALETFADEVRTIKAAVATIRADAATFLSGIADGVEKKHYGAYGTSTTETIEWHEDRASVDANNALIRRTNDQQEALWAAERKCANAIYDTIGHKHIDAASEANCGQGYGVDQIPDNAEMPWGQTVAKTENCGEKVVHGVANGAGSMAAGFASLAGFQYTGTGLWDHWDWSWDHSWSHAGEAWKGAGMFVVGAATLGTGGLALSTLPGPVGNFFRDSQKVATSAVAGLVAIDLYADDPFHKWKEDGWQAVGESIFNVGTLVVAPTKVGNVGKLGRAGQVVAKVTDPVYLAMQASRAVKSLSVSTVEALARLNRAIDIDSSVKVRPVEIEIPSVTRDHVSTDVPNTGNHDIPDAPPARDYADDRSGPGTRDTDSSAGTDHTSTDHTSTDHTSTDGGHPDSDGHHGDAGTSDTPVGDGTKESPVQYEYVNQAESLRGTPEPNDVILDDVGRSKSYTAGTQEHMYARWNEYGGSWDWDKWRDTYIRNQGHDARGTAFEEAFRSVRDFEGGDWKTNHNVNKVVGIDRNYDLFSAEDRVAYEIKSGTGVDPKQVAKDIKMINAGYEVKYVFGTEPKAAAMRLLDRAGIKYEVFYGNPTVLTHR